LPVTGIRKNFDGEIFNNSVGFYWSSTVIFTDSLNLRFSDSSAAATINFSSPSYGLSVRCIKN
jgi:hypothetical protein